MMQKNFHELRVILQTIDSKRGPYHMEATS